MRSGFVLPASSGVLSQPIFGLSAEERDHIDGLAVFLFGLLREDGDRFESAKRSGETGQRDGLQKVFTVHFHDKTFIFKS